MPWSMPRIQQEPNTCSKNHWALPSQSPQLTPSVLPIGHRPGPPGQLTGDPWGLCSQREVSKAQTWVMSPCSAPPCPPCFLGSGQRPPGCPRCPCSRLFPALTGLCQPLRGTTLSSLNPPQAFPSSEDSPHPTPTPPASAFTVALLAKKERERQRGNQTGSCLRPLHPRTERWPRPRCPGEERGWRVPRLALGLSPVCRDLCPAALPSSLSLYSQALLWGTVSRLDVARLPSPLPPSAKLC